MILEDGEVAITAFWWGGPEDIVVVWECGEEDTEKEARCCDAELVRGV